MALYGWKYKRPIIIDNSNSNKDLFDYQIRIDLNSNNFQFSKAQFNGEDIRFSEDNRGDNLLSLWIENWNSIDSTATIWVKVPHIMANSDITIYMWYGNSLVNTVSDIQGTSLYGLGDDFDGHVLNINKWTITHRGNFHMSVKLDGNSHLHFIHKPHVTAPFGYKTAQVGILSNNGDFTNNFGIRAKRMFTDPHYVDIAIGEGPLGNAVWHTYLEHGYLWAQQNLKNHFIELSCNYCYLVHNKYDKWGNINTYEIIDFIYDEEGYLKWFHNDELKMIAQDKTYLTNPKHILIEQGEYVYRRRRILGGDSYYDWIFTHKVTSNPPKIIIGEEMKGLLQLAKNNLFFYNI